MKQLTKEQIVDIFNRYCYIDCCGRVCHSYRHPEHNTMMPIPEHEGYFLINYEEAQEIVFGNPRVARYGDVEHYPRFDMSHAEVIARFDYGRWDWNEKGYYYIDNIDGEYLVKNPKNNNNFYSCLDNIPTSWGY
jgi:hypothetical protein